MKKLKLILSPFLIIFFFIDIFKYKFFKKKNSEKSYQLMIFFFMITGGISNLLINSILKRRGKLNKHCQEIYDDFQLNKITASLKENGYYQYKSFLLPSDIKIIRDKIIKLKGTYDNDLNNQYENNLDLDNPKSTRYMYSSSDLMEIPEIQDLVVDPNILGVVENYLGSIPIIDYCESWWSFPSKHEDEKAAQMWHFDMDRPKWIKVFFFLNDCNSQNGAHQFIKKTHKIFGIPRCIRRKGYSRIDNDIIKEFFPNNEIILMNAKAGDILFEDTIGLHKGKKLKKGNRLVLQFQYSSSLFGSKNQLIKMPVNKSVKFENFIKKNNYSLLNFH